LQKIIGFLSLLFLYACPFAFTTNAAEPKELFWEDLTPKDFFALPPPDFSHDNKMPQLQPNAPLVEALDGQFVKIPGFIVPLEGTAEKTTEFLLVPYFGACVHVPPPPSNQIVYVRFTEGVNIGDLYDAVWITGTLSTSGWEGDIASVGYTLSGNAIEPFEP
jgi:hypothetical protein